MKAITDIFVYIVMRFLIILGRLLPEGFFYRLGKLVGELYYRFYPDKRRLTHYNLQRAFWPQKIDDDLVRQNFHRIGMLTAEFLLLPSWSDEKIKERVTIHGQEHLQAALAKGRGAILGGGHIGNWELLLVALGKAGFPVYSIVKEQTLKRTNKLIFALRERMGLGLISKTRFSLRQAYRILANNSVLLVLMDQYGGKNGLPVEFFGSKTSTSAGAALLSQRTGAALLPVAIRPQKPGYYDLIFKPIIATEGRAPEEILRDLNIHLEEEIRLSPTDWLSPTRRWRTDSERLSLDA